MSVEQPPLSMSDDHVSKSVQDIANLIGKRSAEYNELLDKYHQLRRDLLIAQNLFISLSEKVPSGKAQDLKKFNECKQKCSDINNELFPVLTSLADSSIPLLNLKDQLISALVNAKSIQTVPSPQTQTNNKVPPHTQSLPTVEEEIENNEN